MPLLAKDWDTRRRVARASRVAERVLLEIGEKRGGSVPEFGYGTGLVSFAFAGHNGFAHGEIRRMFQETGMRGIRVETFYAGEKPAGEKNVPYSLFCAAGRRP